MKLEYSLSSFTYSSCFYNQQRPRSNGVKPIFDIGIELPLQEARLKFIVLWLQSNTCSLKKRSELWTEPVRKICHIHIRNIISIVIDFLFKNFWQKRTFGISISDDLAFYFSSELIQNFCFGIFIHSRISASTKKQ